MDENRPQIDLESEEYKNYQASLPQDLENQIMDCRIPKNEREHWAAKEIGRLRAEQEVNIKKIFSLSVQLGTLQGKYDSAHWPGIVDGWKERAEKAEADLAAKEKKLDDIVRGRCAVKDCENKPNEGMFVGTLCAPCADTNYRAQSALLAKCKEALWSIRAWLHPETMLKNHSAWPLVKQIEEALALINSYSAKEK